MRVTLRSLLLVLGVLAIAPPVVAQDLPEAACRVLHEERAKHPPILLSICETAGDPRCPLGGILNKAALAGGNGLGLSRKETGFHVTSPAGRVASDVLMLKDGTYWDVFIAGEERAQVSCGGSDGTITDSRRGWVAPVAMEPEPEPDPDPEPEPKPDPEPEDPTLGLILLKIVSLLEEIRDGQTAQSEALQRGLAELKAALDKGVKFRF